VAAKRIAAMSTKEEKEQFAVVRSDEGWLKEGVERRRANIFKRKPRFSENFMFREGDSIFNLIYSCEFLENERKR